MSETFKIRRIDFVNFKAFDNYQVFIGETNILTGPNNSGKSTAISSLRILDSALRYARSKAPERIYVDDKPEVGYRIPNDSIPVSLENVRCEYRDEISTIKFTFSSNATLEIIFPIEGGCVLIPKVEGDYVVSLAAFKKAFPLNIVAVPVLGPVEHQEKRREKSTVRAALSSHRASRHFRSYWHYYPDEFDRFATLIANTWPGMEIEKPEFDLATGELSMFCKEARQTRELYWVGFGFQIWCQLLSYICRARSGTLLVVDEPEVYLHPDIQRQLLWLIRDTGAHILMATHSSEIIAECEPSEILLIDKKKRRAERLKNIAGVQRALDAVGSNQNITLTALAKSRRILFVEGLEDFKIIRRIGKRLGLQELSSGLGIIPLASGGFGSWQRITTLAEGISEALGSPLLIGAVYDRDYFCDEEIEFVLGSLRQNLRTAHVLDRKEIENYLIVPAAICRAANRQIAQTDQFSLDYVRSVLENITAPMKDEVVGQFFGRYQNFHRSKGIDGGKLFTQISKKYEPIWLDLDKRLKIVSGKAVLKNIRDHFQINYNITLTDTRIIEAMSPDDVPTDLKYIIGELDSFRTLEFTS